MGNFLKLATSFTGYNFNINRRYPEILFLKMISNCMSRRYPIEGIRIIKDEYKKAIKSQLLKTQSE